MGWIIKELLDIFFKGKRTGLIPVKRPIKGKTGVYYAIRYVRPDKPTPKGRQKAVPTATIGNEETPLIDIQSALGYSPMKRSETGLRVGLSNRAFDVLGSNLYTYDAARVFYRELIQNAIDALRPLGKREGLKVKITQDLHEDVVVIEDNGVGMTPEVIKDAFLNIGGSAKGDEATGGFGIGKIIIFQMADEIEVISRSRQRDGSIIQSRLYGKGDFLTEGFSLETEVLPEGETGTIVRVKPKEGTEVLTLHLDSFLEHNKTPYPIEVRQRYFHTGEMRVLERDIEVTPQEAVIVDEWEMGNTRFTLEMSKETYRVSLSSVDVVICNRGLYQATHIHYLNDTISGLPKFVRVNVETDEPPESPNYPFNSAREDLKEQYSAELRRRIEQAVLSKLVMEKNERFKKAMANCVQLGEGEFATKGIIGVTDNKQAQRAAEGFFNHPVTQAIAQLLHQAFREFWQAALPNEAPPPFFLYLDNGTEGLHAPAGSIPNPENPNSTFNRPVIFLNPVVRLYRYLVDQRDDEGNSVDFDEGCLLVGGHFCSTLLHEIAHRRGVRHGEDWGLFFTQIVGRVSASGLLDKWTVGLAEAIKEARKAVGRKSWEKYLALIDDTYTHMRNGNYAVTLYARGL